MANEYATRGTISTALYSGDGSYIGCVDSAFDVQITKVDNEGHSRIDILDLRKEKGQQTIMILHLEMVK